MHILRLLLFWTVSAGLLAAQETVYTVKVDVPVVSVDVTVWEPDGRPAASLSAEDFLLYEDGVPHEIRNFAPVTTPYNILLLFDRSGSTQSQWLLMQRAVAGFLSNLRPQDGAAIAAFDDDFQTLLTWRDGREKALQALEQLTRPRALGGTDFYDALERSVSREFRNVAGRRAVIVFTDGRDTGFYRQTVATNRVPESGEDSRFQRLLRAVSKEKVPVYFIAVNTDRNLDASDAGADYLRLHAIYPRSTVPAQFLMEARLRLEQIAEVSGGRVFFPEQLRDVIPLYEQIGRELSTSYSLGYIPVRLQQDGKYRRIEIRTRHENRTVWQSRDGYFAR